MSMLRFSAAATALLLASCVTDGHGTDGAPFCTAASPILVSQVDELTDGTARQILAHNEAGRRLCGW